MVNSEEDRYETISVESKIREGVFHKVVKDLESEKEISYRLVGQDEADIKKNLVFFKSPIGKAMIGKNIWGNNVYFKILNKYKKKKSTQ